MTPTTGDKAMSDREKLIEVMARAMCEALLETGRTDWGGPVPAPNYYGAARKSLAALEAAGVRLVPVEATGDMLAAGMESDSITHPWEALGVYRMMLAASPYAPPEG